MAMTTSTSKKTKNIVVVGGGVQGTSVAYQFTILESKAPASAASGKGGGFMARSWGDGTSTQDLHHLAFDLYEDLATELGCTSYRKLPVLSVAPEGGRNGNGVSKATNDASLQPLMPSWLDGKSISRIQPMGYGEDTAQITPKEFVEKMLQSCTKDISVVLGTCTGMVTTNNMNDDDDEMRTVTGVRYQPRGSDEEGNEQEEEQILSADAVVISAGPWSCQAEDWFAGSNIVLPMEGVKSTSIVWKQPEDLKKKKNGENNNENGVDATALFCGEDDRFQTHLEVYPRPDGTIYICGIGGSDYVTKEELKQGAFRESISANTVRVQAASDSFKELSTIYQAQGELEKTQACMLTKEELKQGAFRESISANTVRVQAASDSFKELS
eukprot:CAMPEP_0170825526 /NCGR_PEP_ID=MMETSP0733-20121128/45989_1 /TAXON_ID=186038 /ORGANISM="Fragilariopsis kerguelensis, Strain L26-C5" /LENGTH=383 /DNA_ID=CAMNT_0011189057 /DNA_START=201 /DNA_END=1348 /DNA_ORIENTATION=-